MYFFGDFWNLIFCDFDAEGPFSLLFSLTLMSILWTGEVTLKKHTYTLISLFVLAGPLAMSFDSKVYFIQYLPAILVATLTVGALYILWDTIVTRQGHWWFNDEFVGSVRILHLPVGEWLFFLVVPYATIFIFEVVEAYFGHGVPQPELWWVQALLALPFFGLIFPFRQRGYTRLSAGSAGVFLVVSAFLAPGILWSVSFWQAIGLSFVAFGLVNGIYTALPTIFYSPQATTGVRVGPIPAEDFLYNLSYIGLTFTVYLFTKGLLGL